MISSSADAVLASELGPAVRSELGLGLSFALDSDINLRLCTTETIIDGCLSPDSYISIESSSMKRTICHMQPLSLATLGIIFCEVIKLRSYDLFSVSFLFKTVKLRFLYDFCLFCCRKANKTKTNKQVDVFSVFFIRLKNPFFTIVTIFLRKPGPKNSRNIPFLLPEK